MISVHKDSRKFLRFQWRDTLYEFVCVPFGLSTAPWLFPKILKPIINMLRNRGLLSVVYLDDWLCLAERRSECLRNLTITQCTLEQLGFVIHMQKSRLIPGTSCQFLGFCLNPHAMTLELPQKKRLHVLTMIRRFRNIKACKIREFVHFVGTLTSVCPAIRYGWVYSKSFERQKYLALLRNHGDYEATMQVSSTLDVDFQWRETCILTATNPIQQRTYHLEISSDASPTGWGAACHGEIAYGVWNATEMELHINYLALLAALFALKCFADAEHDCEILLRLDNTTAIAYINRMGGIQYPGLNVIARAIWHWCERRRIWLFATYIASRDNVEADMGSRLINTDTEWELAPWCFARVVQEFGQPDMDLFASRTNAKCKKYCSWRRDPESFAVDAFTIPWGKCKFYAFPPFALILRALRKLQTDQARGIVVVPNWKTQPWFPLWKKMLVCTPLYFGPHDSILLSSCRTLQHPLAS